MKNPFPTLRNSTFSIHKLPSVNWVLFVCMILLLTIGVLFIRSACAIRTGEVRYLYRDMMFQWIPLGMLVHVLVAKFDYRRWNDWSWVLYLVAIILLALVLVPGIGTIRLGARRWLFGFQPSEFAKIVTIPMAAFLLSGTRMRNGPVKLFTLLAMAIFPAILIIIEPDLGTALAIVPTMLAMAFVSGCAPKTLLSLCLAGLILISVFLGAVLIPENLPPDRKAKVERITDKVIFGHWKDRILVFVYPDRDPLGAGWNKRQSEIAVGSGGRTGKGYLKGTQNILGFLPRAVSSTDFIYSVIAEETGFNGSMILLVLFGGLLGSTIVTGLLCRDNTGRLICTGVSALLFTHIFVNIAMTIGKMPITGIPLPLISYGGTFTISMMTLLGLVQSVSIHGMKPRTGNFGS